MILVRVAAFLKKGYIHTYVPYKIQHPKKDNSVLQDQYVIEFEKTIHVCTRIEIHLIAYCNSHTCALSRHNSKTGIDKQVYFYRRPVIDPVKS